MPTVSVIVPNYNHARFLPKRVESVLRQTNQDFEVILLDDCSTDESRSVLMRYTNDPRVRVEFNETNSGSTFKQWNKGVRMARGKYVWIAESDDYADERLMERLVRILDADADVTFAYCRSWRVTESGEMRGFAWPYLDEAEWGRWAENFVVDGKQECRKYLSRANTVPNASAVLFRKDVYEAVGGPDESLRLCADWKLWAMMAMRGSVGYVSEPLNYYRFHEASVRAKSAQRSADFCERLRVVRWIGEEVDVAEPEREWIARELAHNWVSLILSFRVPLVTKKTILRDVRAIDPRPLRRILVPAIATVQRKIMRHWRDLRAMAGRHAESKAQ